jgi:hypothetical protein
VPASKAEQVLDALKALLETVAAPLFWLDVSHEVTTRYSYDGAKVVPPQAPALEEVRLLAIERVEHGAARNGD